MRAFRIAAIAACALTAAGAAVAGGPAGGPGSAPEPAGLYQGALAGYTPSTLSGAAVVDTAAVAELVAAGGVVLLDVGPADRRPDTLPKTAIWRPQHRSIPGAVWMPGAGPGDLPEASVAALKARVAALTGGDMARPVVAFCKPDCWGSWNLGKRLVTWGYTGVRWFPQGIDGWLQADKETAVVKADPEWSAATQTAPER